MLIAPRMILILTLMTVISTGLSAQTTSTTTTASTESASATTTATSETASGEVSDEEPSGAYAVREQFTALLNRSPSDLSTVLVLEPTLLSNDSFLAGYPEVARFVAAHPEIRRSPRFYMTDLEWRANRTSPLDHFVETIGIFAIFLLISLALAWFMRTVIEQKRWNRLARTQSEVHNKILDRFNTSEELLDYVKSPAGTRFLESAPIPLHQEPPQNAPLGRAIWSVQIGVVVAAGALGMLLVSGRFDKETAQGMFALGAIGFAVGAGFIVSAIVSLILSKRLGLWKAPVADEASLVR